MQDLIKKYSGITNSFYALTIIYSFKHKWEEEHHVRILETHLRICAVVFGAQIEARQAAGQVQPTEKPHQIPEHNRVVIHNGCR